LGRTFEFDHFYALEDVIISLQTVFGDTKERADLLQLLGTIKDENVRTATDDGITQSVTVKAGIQIVEGKEAPNRVELVPFRTFREIDQPASPFVLRLRQGREGGLPTAALFEADGGQWSLTAIASIKAFLEEAIEGVPIIA
jgi:hypothetical protein